MKRSTLLMLLVAALCVAASVVGQNKPDRTKLPPRAEVPVWADSLPSLYLYTEGIKQNVVAGDSLRARELFTEAVRRDSTFAPAWYELALATLAENPARAVDMARRAHEIDTADMWYHHLYGQALVMSGRYDRALGVFRSLRDRDPRNPDFYRILAALYEEQQQPFSAIATLDSAEVRFGRIPMLGAMKRRLLVKTRQIDKAVAEARALVDAAPYEVENHVVLATLYAASDKDSLARAEYDSALKIDSTSLPALLALADFLEDRRDFRASLAVTRRLFALDALPLENKVRKFERLTSDIRFYREYYFPINDLAQMLAIRYPREKRVVELYAGHLVASGEIEQALALYKLRTLDTPPDADYFHAVIDIENYLQRPDSAARYIDRALELFPANAAFHIAKGHAATWAERYPEALKAYKNSLRHADSDSLRGATWGFIGDTWHRIADQSREEDRRSVANRRKAAAESYKAYDRSLRYWADNAAVLNNYAYYLALEGRNLERALALSSRAVELTDNSPTCLDTHAWVLFRSGRVEEARKIMQQAVALDGRNSPELLVHYGDILDALGQRFIAETYWRKALEKGYDADAITRRFETRP